MLEVLFKGRKIEDGKKLSMGMVKKEPEISWNMKKDRLYTIIMYDLDAPYPNKGSVYLHMLIINIPNQGEILANYIPPSPPEDSSRHRYIIRLLKQESFLDILDIEERANFPLEDFIRENNLKTLDRILFFVKKDSIRKKGSDNPGKSDYFIETSNIEESKGKYCRCVLHVAAKNPEWCNIEKAWFDERDGETCYNPYAVCAKSTRTSYRHCSEEYDLNNIPYSELKYLAQLKGIEYSSKEDIIRQLQK